MNERIILEAVNLTKVFETPGGAVRAVNGVCVHLRAGELVTVVGDSGSGKSTLLGLLGGLDTPTSGQVSIDGVDLADLDENALADVRREKVGFVFQAYNLLSTLSALDNVALPLELSGVGRTQRRERAEAVLAEVGLDHRLFHRPAQLSGGEQQRVALARAVVTRPVLLLADEPTGNLDSTATARIMELIRDLNANRGVTVVMVTHNRGLSEYASRWMIMTDGSLSEDGPC